MAYEIPEQNAEYWKKQYVEAEERLNRWADMMVKQETEISRLASQVESLKFMLNEMGVRFPNDGTTQ